MNASLRPRTVEGSHDLLPHGTEYENIDLAPKWHEGDLRRNSQEEEDENEFE